MAQKINPKQLEQSGATHGQFLMWDGVAGTYAPNTVVVSGGGGTANTTVFVPTAAAPTSNNVQLAMTELADFLFCIKIS